MEGGKLYGDKEREKERGRCYDKNESEKLCQKHCWRGNLTVEP